MNYTTPSEPRDSRIVWSDNVKAADWIREGLHDFHAYEVGSVIPEGFESYARVLHPTEEDSPRTWAEVAAENGRIVHPLMQFPCIDHPVGTSLRRGWDAYNDMGPSEGDAPPQVLDALVDILRTETTTPDHCYFCMWEGKGTACDFSGLAHRVLLPNREYALYEGPIDFALISLMPDSPFSFPANLWWPEDCAWIVTTEVDHAWTYVGGTNATIDRVLADPRLETFLASPDDLASLDSDTINAALDQPETERE